MSNNNTIGNIIPMDKYIPTFPIPLFEDEIDYMYSEDNSIGHIIIYKLNIDSKSGIINLRRYIQMDIPLVLVLYLNDGGKTIDDLKVDQLINTTYYFPFNVLDKNYCRYEIMDWEPSKIGDNQYIYTNGPVLKTNFYGNIMGLDNLLINYNIITPENLVNVCRTYYLSIKRVWGNQTCLKFFYLGSKEGVIDLQNCGEDFPVQPFMLSILQNYFITPNDKILCMGGSPSCNYSTPPFTSYDHSKTYECDDSNGFIKIFFAKDEKESSDGKIKVFSNSYNFMRVISTDKYDSKYENIDYSFIKTFKILPYTFYTSEIVLNWVSISLESTSLDILKELIQYINLTKTYLPWYWFYTLLKDFKISELTLLDEKDMYIIQNIKPNFDEFKKILTLWGYHYDKNSNNYKNLESSIFSDNDRDNLIKNICYTIPSKIDLYGKGPTNDQLSYSEIDKELKEYDTDLVDNGIYLYSETCKNFFSNNNEKVVTGNQSTIPGVFAKNYLKPQCNTVADKLFEKDNNGDYKCKNDYTDECKLYDNLISNFSRDKNTMCACFLDTDQQKKYAEYLGIELENTPVECLPGCIHFKQQLGTTSITDSFIPIKSCSLQQCINKQNINVGTINSKDNSRINTGKAIINCFNEEKKGTGSDGGTESGNTGSSNTNKKKGIWSWIILGVLALIAIILSIFYFLKHNK